MVLRKIYYWILIILFGLADINGQELLYDEANVPRIKSRAVKADLGGDINASPLTTVILDASRSKPQNGSLSYEWTFAPNLIFKEDYDYDESDALVPYTPAETGDFSADSKTSIKRIITRNKYIELDIPNVTKDTQFSVSLRVQNHVGSTDSDSLIITVEAPIDESYVTAFSDAVQEDQENISTFTVVDEPVEEYREPLTETVINADYLTIQPLNKQRLNPMEVEIINSFIFDFLQDRGIKNILDPNRKIPNEVQVNKLYQRTRLEPDTVLLVYRDTLSVNDDRSGFQEAPIDTIVKDIVGDTTGGMEIHLVYRRYETVTAIDTLFFTEVVDTTLRYNFNCQGYDCAAENAYLEQAGQVLAWGINDYSELEFHYFTLNDIYAGEPSSRWIAEPIVLSPYADSTLRYPESVGIDSDGSLVVAAGNRQKVFRLGQDLHPLNAIENESFKDAMIFPGGIASGYLGELYVTDKYAHSIYKIYEGEFNTVFSASRDKDGIVLQGEPTAPTSICVNPQGEVVVLFEGDGSIHKFDLKGQKAMLLKPGILDSPSDIALSSNGSLFVTSSDLHQVFRVANDSTAVPIAGTQGGTGAAMDGVMSIESFLGAPVSIDFDASDRLYIADNAFGSIRVVSPDGMINTLTEKDNRVFDVAQMRISDYGLTTVYTTHTLGHEVTRVRYHTASNSSKFHYIYFPHYTIKHEGIYGLEDSIRIALESVLTGPAPKEKRSIISRLKESNRRFSEYLKRNPLFFGLLLLLINQGVSAALGDGGSSDLPPDFPF